MATDANSFRSICAHEHPELLLRGLKVMFRKGGGVYRVVNGYEKVGRARLRFAHNPGVTWR